MPSYALNSLLSDTCARKSMPRTAKRIAVIALLTSGCALAQAQVAENALTVFPIEMIRFSSNSARVSGTASFLTTSIFATPPAFHSRLADWRTPATLASSTPTLFLQIPEVTDSKRDRSLQTPSPHRAKGFFVGKASWILQQAIGDDGIEDLKHGCRVAKRFALLR